MVVPVVLVIGGGMGFFLLYMWARPYGGIRNALTWACCRPGGGGLLGCLPWYKKKAAKVAPIADEPPPDSKPGAAAMVPSPTGTMPASPGGSPATSSPPPQAGGRIRFESGGGEQPPRPTTPTLDHAVLSPASKMRGKRDKERETVDEGRGAVVVLEG